MSVQIQSFEFYDEMQVDVIRKQRTTVVILTDGDTITVGEARCNPKDVYNPNLGLRLAFKRALAKNRRYASSQYWWDCLNHRGQTVWRAFRRQFPIATDTRQS
jgi:hypothetical protein